MTDFINKHKALIIWAFVAFAMITIASKNSFLYPLNDWVDVNAFFTMGKSMMNGIVPYRDVFEQKGPLLYFIYGIGYLISHKSFFGVYLIEVVFFTGFLYWVNRSVRLFATEKSSIIVTSLLGLITVTCTPFVHGGSVEEFCLPIFAYGIYITLRHFKGEECTPFEYAINGFLAGCVFMMKYTLLGFGFSFMLFLFLDLMTRKQFKKAMLSCLWFLAGMAVPIIIWVVYFIANGAFSDFIECYITINLTAYTRERQSIISKIIELYYKFFKGYFRYIWLAVVSVLIYALLILKLKISRLGKLAVVGTILISVFMMFFGLRFYRYYFLPTIIFFIPVACSLARLMDIIAEKIKLKEKTSRVLSIAVCGVFILLCYPFANYHEMIFWSKADMFQFKYADYISQFENPTLLNMGYLDAGLYTSTGICPNTRFFEVQNIPYDKFPDNLDEMKYAVENQNMDFILYFTRKDLDYIKTNASYIFDNYELVFSDSQDFEHTNYNAFLFQAK